MFARLLTTLAWDADAEYTSIVSTSVRVDQHSTGAPKRTPKNHATVDTLATPVVLSLTPGQVISCYLRTMGHLPAAFVLVDEAVLFGNSGLIMRTVAQID